MTDPTPVNETPELRETVRLAIAKLNGLPGVYTLGAGNEMRVIELLWEDARKVAESLEPVLAELSSDARLVPKVSKEATYCGKHIPGAGGVRCVLVDGHTGPCSDEPQAQADEALRGERHRIALADAMGAPHYKTTDDLIEWARDLWTAWGEVLADRAKISRELAQARRDLVAKDKGLEAAAVRMRDLEATAFRSRRDLES